MNYDDLLNIKVKCHLIFIIIIVSIIASAIYVLNIDVYDNYNSLGIYKDSIIYINVPIDYSDTLTKGEYLKIENHKYSFQILEISDIEVDASYVNYQTFKIKIDKEYQNNEVLEIIFLGKKEKIIKKLKDII